MQLLVTLHMDEDGLWIAECPAIPGCVSQGVTRDAAMRMITDAIEQCLAVRRDVDDLPLTIECRTVEVAD